MLQSDATRLHIKGNWQSVTAQACPRAPSKHRPELSPRGRAVQVPVVRVCRRGCFRICLLRRAVPCSLRGGRSPSTACAGHAGTALRLRRLCCFSGRFHSLNIRSQRACIQAFNIEGLSILEDFTNARPGLTSTLSEEALIRGRSCARASASPCHCRWPPQPKHSKPLVYSQAVAFSLLKGNHARQGDVHAVLECACFIKTEQEILPTHGTSSVQVILRACRA